jgi:hypothetical protein
VEVVEAVVSAACGWRRPPLFRPQKGRRTKMHHLATLGRFALPTLLAFALLVAALPAAGEQTGQIETPNASVWNGPLVLGTDAALPADSMRAAVDSRGHLRRPTAAEALTLDLLAAPVFSRAVAALQVERADGTVVMAVDPELINYSVVRVDASGAAAFSCVDGPSNAGELTHTAPAPAVAEVK